MILLARLMYLLIGLATIVFAAFLVVNWLSFGVGGFAGNLILLTATIAVSAMCLHRLIRPED